MKRRDALKISGLGLGITISGASLVTLISSCQQDISSDYSPIVFDNQEFKILNEISEIILPATDTPGAKDAKVADFIDLFVSRIFPEEMQTDFKSGIVALNEECLAKQGKGIDACSSDELKSFIASIESSNYKAPVSIWGNTVEEGSSLPFYKQLKQMIMWGYFSSEVAGKEVLLYKLLAPDYNGCVELTEDMKLPSV